MFHCNEIIRQFIAFHVCPILTYWNKPTACLCVRLMWEIVTFTKNNIVSSLPIPIKLSNNF